MRREKKIAVIGYLRSEEMINVVNHSCYCCNLFLETICNGDHAIFVNEVSGGITKRREKEIMTVFTVPCSCGFYISHDFKSHFRRPLSLSYVRSSEFKVAAPHPCIVCNLYQRRKALECGTCEW